VTAAAHPACRLAQRQHYAAGFELSSTQTARLRPRIGYHPTRQRRRHRRRCAPSGVRSRKEDPLASNRGLHDSSNSQWRHFKLPTDLDVPQVVASQSGRPLASLARRHRTRPHNSLGSAPPTAATAVLQIACANTPCSSPSDSAPIPRCSPPGAQPALHPTAPFAVNRGQGVPRRILARQTWVY
jgi:hypothetical protein